MRDCALIVRMDGGFNPIVDRYFICVSYRRAIRHMRSIPACP